MRLLSKKDCPDLLAYLGEESLQVCKKRAEEANSIGVSWVGHHIVTVEACQGQLLIRVTAVLPKKYEDDVERKICDAAMRESGYYHFSVRALENFALAEITIYGVSNDQFTVLSQELTKMSNLLDGIFSSF